MNASIGIPSHQQPPSQTEDGGDPAPAKPAASRAARGPARAGHGYVNEVRWHSGEGRQPYANRGPQEAAAPNLGDEFEGGDRGAHSGNTLMQMALVKRKP